MSGDMVRPDRFELWFRTEAHEAVAAAANEKGRVNNRSPTDVRQVKLALLAEAEAVEPEGRAGSGRFRIYCTSAIATVSETWLLLGNILHSCLWWFSGKSPLNC